MSGAGAHAQLIHLEGEGMHISAVGIDVTTLQHVRYSDVAIETAGARVVGDIEVRRALDSLVLNGANSAMVWSVRGEVP